MQEEGGLQELAHVELDMTQTFLNQLEDAESPQ